MRACIRQHGLTRTSVTRPLESYVDGRLGPTTYLVCIKIFMSTHVGGPETGQQRKPAVHIQVACSFSPNP